jgi:Clr5 domain
MDDTQSHEDDGIALRPPSNKEWESAKREIHKLYIEQELPLKAVQAQIKECGFVGRYATKRTFFDTH